MSDEQWSTESAEMAAAMRPKGMVPWIVGGGISLVAIVVAIVGFSRASDLEQRLATAQGAQQELETARTQLTAATSERDRLTLQLTDAQRQLAMCASRPTAALAPAGALSSSAPAKHAPAAKRPRRRR